MRDLDRWLKALVSNIDSLDRPLADEIRAHQDADAGAPKGSRAARAGKRLVRGAAAAHASMRNIVLRVGRPVLAVIGGAAQLDFTDGESEVWRARLQQAGTHLQHATQAVGRINVKGIAGVDYVGTGWLVAPDAIITNRHVAMEFARRTRGRFTFKQGIDDAPIRTSIDFLEEVGRDDRREFPIVDILYVEDKDGPDLALLRVKAANERLLARPIALASDAAKPEQQVAVIGYPAKDDRAADAALMQSIFGTIYDKKRLAPGQITEVRSDVLLHDCSTLGGNSGSVVIDLKTGHAIGLHFAGRFLEANYALPASVIADRLDRVLGHAHPGRPPHHDHASGPAVVVTSAVGTLSTGPASPPEDFVEGVPADYAGRAGYDAAFVGFDVPLPTVKNTADVLTFPWEGQQASVLKYEHFSVVMSRSRRLCIFSAGNIDGSQPRRFKRPAWRLDPRIPKTQQILNECYGNEPLFARGHMTRREDPVWGTPDEASLGNSDSMHVTNTVPQMQPFNAGIWLALESYALDHARSDQMRISVFTGPFLLSDDPVRVGVLVPRSFWKVIAFVHDDTKALCATGYTMSQEAFLHDEEFVFGQHTTTQTRIGAIEERAGVSFGPLTALDPLAHERGVDVVLTDPSQIRFVRR